MPQPQRPTSSSTHSVAVAKEGPVYFATASNTRVTFIESDMPLREPEAIAALESMAGFSTSEGPVYLAIASNTPATSIKSQVALGAPETITPATSETTKALVARSPLDA